jgi:hypothetical protein
MQLVKQSYVEAMRAIAMFGPSKRLIENGKAGTAYGWQRWAASLFAIHDVRRMMALELPWWNVKATREAEAHLAARPGARIFEYGAGASTAWLARRAGSVISVEHNAIWQRTLRPMLADLGNVQLWERGLDGDAYIGAIDETDGPFDLIVIDGRRRTECLAHALPRLATGGIILFDDSGRWRYRHAIKTCGLRERRYFGRSYCVPYPDFTSILHG